MYSFTRTQVARTSLHGCCPGFFLLLRVLCCSAVLFYSDFLAAKDVLFDQLAELSLDELSNVNLFDIDARTDQGYAARQVITGSRFSVDPMEFPMSITVMTRSFMNDLGMEDIEDTFNYLGSVNKSGGERDGEERSVRGFTKNDVLPALRNGMMLMYYSDTVNWSRIEVLKGPTSVLYGQTGPAGVINYITRKPSFSPEHRILLKAGSYDKYRGEIELTGPIPIVSDDILAYRFSASLTDSGTDEKAEHLDKIFYNAALTWNILQKLSLTVEYEKLERDWTPSQGPVLISNADGTLTYDRTSFGIGKEEAYWRGPDDYFNNHSELALATLDWEINEALNYRFSFMAGDFERQVYARNPSFLYDAAEALTLTDIDQNNNQPLSHIGRYPIQVRRTIEQKETWQMRHDLSYVFTLADTEHSVMLSYDKFELKIGENANDNAKDWMIVPPWDPDNPSLNEWDDSGIYTDAHLVTGWPKLPESAYGDLTLSNNKTGHEALSLNGLSAFFDDSFHLMWGVRHDKVHNPDVDETTWQLGGIYRVNNAINPFANYGTTFQNNGIGRNGEVLSPESGVSMEAGIKFRLWAEMISGSVAYFVTERENILKFVDVIEDGVKIDEINVASGKDRSQGVDLDMVITVEPSWQTVFSATLMDHEVKESDTDPVEVGQSLRFGADEMFSVFSMYNFIESALSGLSVGLGMNYRSDIRVGNSVLQNRVDSRTLFDGVVKYMVHAKSGDFTLALNLYNISDKEYIDRGQGWGEPFTAVLSITAEL